MSEIMLLYLFTRVDKIIAIVGMLGGLFLIIGFITAMTADCAYDITKAEKKSAFRRAKITALCAIPVFFLCALIPTQKDLSIIVGGKMAIDIARSEPVTDLAKKLYKLVDKKLDEATK